MLTITKIQTIMMNVNGVARQKDLYAVLNGNEQIEIIANKNKRCTAKYTSNSLIYMMFGHKTHKRSFRT